MKDSVTLKHAVVFAGYFEKTDTRWTRVVIVDPDLPVPEGDPKKALEVIEATSWTGCPGQKVPLSPEERANVSGAFCTNYVYPVLEAGGKYYKLVPFNTDSLDPGGS